ncbi:MAG: hypothetical protein IJ481_02675 [Alphaproteobacteria bacterium]|nr:hypothetical protein [Alphaproteobacteria bacterium]
MKLFRYTALIVSTTILSYALANDQKIRKNWSTQDESFVYYQKKPKNIINAGKKSLIEHMSTTKKINSKTSQSNDTSPRDVKTVINIANINGVNITNIDILNSIKLVFFLSGKKLYENGKMDETTKNAAKLLVKPILESLIKQRILKQCSRVIQSEASESDIKNALQSIANSNNATVDEIVEQLKSYGITKDSFKEHIESQLVYPVVAQSLTQEYEPTQSEIKDTKKHIADQNLKTRYQVSILNFKTKNDALDIKQLIDNGFSFEVIFEILQNEKLNSENWSDIKEIPEEARPVISNMNIGTITNVIETKNGYILIKLHDKANPRETGQKQKIYKFFHAMAQTDPLATNEEQEQFKSKINDIAETQDVESIKNKCNEIGIKFEQQEIQNPAPFYRQLIDESISQKKPVVISAPDNSSAFIIIFDASSFTPCSKAITDEEVKAKIKNEKQSKELQKQMNYLRSMSQITINEDALKDVIL